jgi:hypothetical protein
MTGGGVDEARAGVLSNVLALEQRNIEGVAESVKRVDAGKKVSSTSA